MQTRVTSKMEDGVENWASLDHLAMTTNFRIWEKSRYISSQKWSAVTAVSILDSVQNWSLPRVQTRGIPGVELPLVYLCMSCPSTFEQVSGNFWLCATVDLQIPMPYAPHAVKIVEVNTVVRITPDCSIRAFTELCSRFLFYFFVNNRAIFSKKAFQLSFANLSCWSTGVLALPVSIFWRRCCSSNSSTWISGYCSRWTTVSFTCILKARLSVGGEASPRLFVSSVKIFSQEICTGRNSLVEG